MSVREYIGARYVPLFAEPLQWSDQQEYEPLTIVINAGNSYTSRQFVPKGIDISNTNYWALTGNYNAQVEQYRQEVKGAVNDIKNINDSRILKFNTVSDMVASNFISVGDIVETLGRNSINDSGGAFYSIKTGLTPNGMDIIDLGTMQAKYINKGHVNIEQFDVAGKKDISDILQYALDNYSEVHVTQNKNYPIAKQIFVRGGQSLISDRYENIGSKTSDCTFIWVGSVDSAAISTITTETNPFYDAYPQYGSIVKNISVNGNNSLGLGFLITGQQSCYVDEVTAINCTIGICITRCWNFNIGNVHAFWCDLGVSTVPATTLDATFNPVLKTGVNDGAVNNMSIENITAQFCGCGIYMNVVLQTCFSVIDVEACTNVNGYGIRFVSCASFLPNVHIERASDMAETHIDMDFSNIFAGRIPSFGCVQCSVIKTNRYAPTIETLIPFKNYGEYATFIGELVNRPKVKTYIVPITSDWLDGKYLPNCDVAGYMDGAAVKCALPSTTAAVVVYNTGNAITSNTMTITFSAYGGYQPAPLNVPDLGQRAFMWKAVKFGYNNMGMPIVNGTVANAGDQRAFICNLNMSD